MAQTTRAADLTQLPYGEEWPRLTRFYGLSFRELSGMPRWAIRAYVEAIEGLAAEEHGLALEAALYPHMDEEHAEGVNARMREALGVPDADRLDPGIAAHVAKLAGMGIKVVTG